GPPRPPDPQRGRGHRRLGGGGRQGRPGRRPRDRQPRGGLRPGERSPAGGLAGHRDRGPGRAKRRRALGSRGDRRAGAHRRAPVHHPAVPAQARRAPHDPGGLMSATAPVDHDKPLSAARPSARPRRGRRSDPKRWIREARGIVAIVLAGFAVVSLAMFDPALPPAEQLSPVGPVGWGLGGALFRVLGYAGFLLPLLAAAWGMAAFVRPRMAKGWVPLAGLGV